MKRLSVTVMAVCCLFFSGCVRSGTLARFALLEEWENTTAQASVRYRGGASDVLIPGTRAETNGWERLEIRVYGQNEPLDEKNATLFVESAEGRTEIPFAYLEESSCLYACLDDFPQVNFKIRYVVF